MFRRLAMVLLSSLLLWLCASPGRADSEYQQLLDRALAAHAAQDYEAARVSMERAHLLEPSARTLRGLGIIAHAEGRLVDAVILLEQSLASAVRPLPPDLRGGVETLLSTLSQKLGRIRLTIDPAQSSVLVDAATPSWHGPGELLVPPGVHRLTVMAEGRASYELSLEVRAGAVEAVHVILAPVPPVVIEPRDTAVPSAREQPRPTLRGWTPSVRNIALVSGTTLVLTGVALWLTAWRRFEVIDHDCRQRAGGACDRTTAQGRLDEAKVAPLSRVAGVSTAIGAVVLVGAAAFELRLRRSRQAARAKVTATVAPTNVGLRLQF